MTAANSRILFLAGDLAASAIACAMIALAAGVAIPQAWPAWAAMAAGMLIGMVLSVPCWLAAGILLGMIEPMLQIMLGGMLAGMAGGMVAARQPSHDIATLVVFGAVCGGGSALAVACADWMLRNWGTECR